MRQTAIQSPKQNGYWWRYILSLGLVIGIYVTTGIISGRILTSTPQLPLIWLPSGIMLAIVMLGGYRYTVGVFIGVLCLGLIREQPLLSISALALSNAITVAVGAYLLTSVWCIETNLKRIRDIVLLVVVGGFGMMLLGSIFVTIISRTQADYSSINIIRQFLTLWMGSSLSVMFITPLIFAWVDDRTGIPSRRIGIEAIGLITFTIILGWVSHSNILQLETTIPIFYFMLPPIIWAMIRFRLREVTLVNTIMIGFMVWGAQTPQNIIYEMSINNRILFVWSTIAIGSVALLLMKVLIDERRRMEQTLIVERDMNAQILEALGQGISVVSKSGTFEYVNPAFAKLLEMDTSELVGLSPYEVIADSFKPDLDNVFKSRQDGQSSSYQAVLKNSRGEEISVLTTGVTRYLDGEYNGSISVMTDIRPLVEAEKQLKQSEARFRAIFENSADSIILIDASGKILMVNRSHQQLLGYSAEELLTMSVPDYLSTDDHVRGAALFQRALDHKINSYQFELEYICKDKSIRWIDASVGMVWGEDGNHLYSIVISRDITESRNIKLSIESSEKRFRAIFENASIPIALTRHNRRFGLVNPAYAKMLGYSADELTGMKFDDITYPGDNDENIVKYQQLLDGDINSFTVTKRYMHRDGTTVWVNLSVSRFEGNIPTDDEGGLYTIAIAENITERRLAEQQLLQSESFFRAIFENSADSIAVIAKSGKILLSNERHQNLVGYPSVELVNMRAMEYVHPDDVARGVAMFEEAINKRLDTYEIEWRFVHRDQTIRWVHDSVGLIWGHEGNHQYTIAVSRDITESRNIQLAIENSEKRFRAIFENASLPIAVTRENHGIGMVNRAFCNMLGYRADELQNMKFDDITYPGDNEENNIKFQQLLDDEIDHFTLTKRYVHKDGSSVWANLSVSRFEGNIPTDDGESLYTIAIVENITERRLVEQELQRSESFLRAVFENSADSVVVVDTSSLIVMSNPAHQQLVGYSATELSKMTVRDFVHSDDIEREEALFQQALEQHKDSYQIELRFIRRDKTIRWVDASVGLVWDKDGNYQHAIAVSRDITESRNIKLTIENNEKRFRAIFENAGLPITVAREDHMIEMANPAFCNMLGYTVEELQQMTFDEFTHPDDKTVEIYGYQKLVNKEVDHYNVVKRYFHRDGSIVWVNLSISLFIATIADVAQTELYTVAIAENITERKATELALKESEEQYRSIFENSLVGIYRSTTDGRFIRVNPEMVAMLGYDTPQDLYDLDIPNDVYVNAQERDSADRLQSYDETDMIETNSLLKKKNGDVVRVNTRANVIRDTDGNILYFEGSMIDITEQHRQAEEIQQLNQDLEQRVRERTEQLELANEQLLELDRLRTKFIADISHEMRTPLAVLNTRLYLMEHRKNNDTLERHIEGFRTQLDRLEEFVENAFDISVIDMSRDNIKYETISLNDIVENAVSQLAPRAEIHNLGLSYQLDPTLPLIIGVERHLSQVATNLVSNAIKYTSSGQIDVITGIDSMTNRVFLRVTDTGMGIAEEDLPHLFSRFYRGQRAGQSSISGTGLGLSIVKEIVDAHDGQIEIDSHLNEGSVVTIWLPIDLPHSTDQTQDDAAIRDE